MSRIMKLLSYTPRHSSTYQPRIAVLSSSSTVRPLSYPNGQPVISLHDLIERWEETQDGAGLKQDDEESLEGIEMLAPLRGRDVLAVGYNYKDHQAELRAGHDPGLALDYPEYPVFFTKRATSIVGKGHPIYPHPDFTQKLDYEGELGIIVGKGGRGITKEEAWDHVWGATIINDVSARDRQKMHAQVFIGKSLDTFCPMGPYATPKSAIDFTKLSLTTCLNDKVVQHQSTNEMIFDIPTLISTLSGGITLQPGDVIATGTPAGTGSGTGRYLNSGDRVDVDITGLGVLSNTVAEPTDSPKIRSMREERAAGF